MFGIIKNQNIFFLLIKKTASCKSVIMECNGDTVFIRFILQQCLNSFQRNFLADISTKSVTRNKSEIFVKITLNECHDLIPPKFKITV